MAKKIFFHIETQMLGKAKIFPFHLYIYNPYKNTYSPFLQANSPMTKEKSAFLVHLVKKGAIVAINERQKLTFTRSMQIREDKIRAHTVEDGYNVQVSSTPQVTSSSPKPAMDKKQAALKEKLKKEKFIPGEAINEAASTEDFSKLIARAKDEIMSFNLRVNHTMSLAAHLGEKFLNEDNEVNRVVTLSYFFSKIMGVSDDETLAILVCAAFFSHIGYTQMPVKISQNSHDELIDVGQDYLKKHQKFAGHLIRKSGIELDNRVIEIIQDHHERVSGKGYPSAKAGDSIDQLALIIGLVSEFVETAAGKVDSENQGIKNSCSVFLENKEALSVDFGKNLYENFLDMFKTGSFKAAA